MIKPDEGLLCTKPFVIKKKRGGVKKIHLHGSFLERTVTCLNVPA